MCLRSYGSNFVFSKTLFRCPNGICYGFPGGSVVKNLAAMQETRV